MRIFWIAAYTIAICGISANAWRESKKCDGHDGDKVDRRDLLVELNDETVPAVVKRDNKHPSSSGHATERNLRGRELGANPTIETIQLKMHWEEEYCWQLEDFDRRYVEFDLLHSIMAFYHIYSAIHPSMLRKMVYVLLWWQLWRKRRTLASRMQ